MRLKWIFAAAAAAASVSGSAAAIDTFAPPQVMDLPGLRGSLGNVEFTALGRSGDHCRYLMEWESPFNANDVQLCEVFERRTVQYPSCIANRHKNLATVVQAGPLTTVPSYCSGFDNLGVRIDTGDITLLLAGPDRLAGVVILPWGTAFSVELRPLHR
jgi:hypothetical protein